MAEDRDEEHDIADEIAIAANREVTSDERTWAIVTHAAAFAGFVFPFGNILGPLLIWAIKKNDSAFVNENGINAINFQITWTILLLLAALSVIVLIGLLLLPLVAVAWFVLVIIAIIRASNDEVYEYPLTLEIVSKA